jgi:ferritin
MKKPETLTPEVLGLITPRLKDEFSAAYFYRSAANWCKNVGFNKAAAFFEAESTDELAHAKAIEDFLVDWNVSFPLPLPTVPPTTFANIGDVIQKAYDIEYELYEAYEDTSAKIFKTGDLCVFDFLQKFRTIQTKSVAEYSDMINKLEGCIVGDKFQMLVLEETLFEV